MNPRKLKRIQVQPSIEDVRRAEARRIFEQANRTYEHILIASYLIYFFTALTISFFAGRLLGKIILWVVQ